MRLLQTLGLKPPAPRAAHVAADDAGGDDPDPDERPARSTFRFSSHVRRRTVASAAVGGVFVFAF